MDALLATKLPLALIPVATVPLFVALHLASLSALARADVLRITKPDPGYREWRVLRRINTDS